MHPSSAIPLALLALAAAHAFAVSAALLRARYVPCMAPGSSPEQTHSGGGDDDDTKGTPPPPPPPPLLRNGAKKLPGFNHKPVVVVAAPSPGNKTAAAAAAAAATQQQQQQQRGVFGDQCQQLALLGGSGNKGQSTLQAACRDGENPGAWWLTSLNLNQCLGNDGGRLVFQERGNYDATCRPCGIETLQADGRIMLRCACLPGPGRTPTFTELSLEHHDGLGISAINGRLVCGSHQGTKSPRFSAASGNGGER